ncbi:sigma-70 family RNA polymerase sigma factor [Methylobacterium gnaphalii]|uniref:Uncharacterized protein n=1 Tax=Methylobacterium gnaphalii TaxID=1010610 RepID=A0A512JP16_9HYPH|nr:sigma-70 family RNA polymerase sigma factor [Methylobacterium gnaphalii]GEP11682.1 hypothetical protein MGN01_35270 [Methylobacterium gnaphalii]GJD71341.1 hypothetical protein MMMDOFMJ_4297 [Methylobacterium gnaphalii]GLS50180.1 hypothetical protein GCM10007885_30320 [Methylobacterium gnaphalii]
MTDQSPSAQRRAKRTEAQNKRPEQRPVYRRRPIVRQIEIRIPLPPKTTKSFFRVGDTRVSTPAYKSWLQGAVLAISSTVPAPGRIAGICDVDIYMPTFTGKPENRTAPCLDAAAQAGIIAAATEQFVREVRPHPGTETTDIRMVLTAIPVEDQDAAEIELRHREGHSPKLISAALGISIGQVETIIAGLKR